MQDRVKNEIIVLEVVPECAITDFGKDVPGHIDTKHAFHLPHQVSANSESSDLTAHCRVKRLVKVVAGMQPDIGIKPVIISRDRLVQLRIESNRKVVRDLCFGIANNATNSGTTSFALQVQCIYARAQSRFFHPHKILNNPGDIFLNATAQWSDWNARFSLVAV